MSISSRNQRVKLHPYAPTNDGGYMTSGYGAARGTFFARISPVVGNELTIAEQADHKERCIFEFDYSIAIGKDDLIIDPDAIQWKVESVTPRRSNGVRAQIVRAFRNADEPVVVPA